MEGEISMEINLITKIKIAASAGVDIVALVYLIFLHHYNQTLEKIQDIHEGRIEKAFFVSTDPDFVAYLIWFVVLVILLVAVSVLIFKSWEELGVKGTAIIIGINLLVGLVLINEGLNPLITSFAVVVLCFGGVYYLMTSKR